MSQRIADEDESCDAESYFAPDPSGDMVTEMDSNSLFEPEAPPMYFARWMGFQELAPLRACRQRQQPLLIEEKVDGVYSSGARAEKSDDVVERRYFRLGTNGSASSLHHDEYHNLFAQIRGEKDWWLLPPTSWRHAKASRKATSAHANRRGVQSLNGVQTTWQRRVRFRQRRYLEICSTYRPIGSIRRGRRSV